MVPHLEDFGKKLIGISLIARIREGGCEKNLE
jgi:hypothetical protein